MAQSSTPSSRLAGAVDGTRRGLIGHSWGALGSAMAASRNAGVASLVLFDPNDDALVGARNAAGIRAPLTLLAQTRAVCNNQWVATSITPGLGGPGAHATLARSGHCDPEDPTDALCPLLCGSGDVATTALFRRYAVAWTRCNLAGDAEMAPWVLGAEWDADQRAGRLTGGLARQARSRASRACAPTRRPADAPDADVPAPDDVPTVIDAGSVATEDVVVSDVVIADLVTSPDAPISDAGARADAGTNARGAGCGCAAGATGPPPSLALLALLGLRRRRAPRRA